MKAVISLPVLGTIIVSLLLGGALPRAAAQSGPPGGGWSDQDIGATGQTGGLSVNGSEVTVLGSGADIWGVADAFHFNYLKVTGDGTAVARVTSLSNTDDWAKAGLMFREDLSPGARNVFAYLTVRSHAGLQLRATGNGASTVVNDEQATTPQWLKLVRAGNSFSAFRSTNGTDWVALGTTTCALPNVVYVGQGVTSHNNAVTASGVFDHLEVTVPPPPPPGGPEWLSCGGKTSAIISLLWADYHPGETGYSIERTTGLGPFEEIHVSPANWSDFADTGLTPNTTYSYRVRTIRGTEYSAYSPTLTVTTLPAPPAVPWQGVDIGYVGLAGAQTIAGSTFTVDAAGNDIWDTADGFHFVYRTLRGDGEILAQVTRLDPTDPWAKAGVMIRESLAPGARNIIAFAAAGGPVGSQTRATTGGSTISHDNGYNSSLPQWVRLVRRGNRVTAEYAFTNPFAGNGGGSIEIPADAEVLVGVAVSSHAPSARTTAVFENTEVIDASPPPPPFTQTNLGQATGVFGTGFTSSGTSIHVTSNGADIWNTGDDGVLVHQAHTGNFEIVGKLNSLTNTHGWAKAGLMIRESESMVSSNVFLGLTPANVLVFQARSGTRASTTESARAWNVGMGATLRIRRTGDVFEAAYLYPETGQWVVLGAQSVVMSTQVEAGVAVSSHDPGAEAEARFEAVTIE